MSTDIQLQCQCARVRGRALEVSPRNGNHIVCYCDDCQAFAHFLGRPDTLDASGGTAIFQMAPARVHITEGADLLRCVRLSERGMHRWYTDCCKTAVANTMGPSFPFVGLIHTFRDHASDGRPRDVLLGEPMRMHGRLALGPPPAGTHPTVPLRLIPRMLRLLATWKLTGRGAPSPFFDRSTGAPRSAPRVLSPAERAALRPAP